MAANLPEFDSVKTAHGGNCLLLKLETMPALLWHIERVEVIFLIHVTSEMALVIKARNANSRSMTQKASRAGIQHTGFFYFVIEIVKPLIFSTIASRLKF